MRNALVKVLKLRCPPGSHSRELLRDAFLVVKLAWRCEVVASPWLAFAVATASPSVPQGQETPQGAIWAHIGFHNFSPYRPCFQILEHVERPSGAYTWLRATQQFKYDYDFVELMHRGSRWGMSMHVLVATQSPLGSFDPQEVRVRRLCSDEEDDRIWPPRRPFRRREPAPEPRAHDAEPAEDFEDVALVPGALDSEDTDNVGPDSESSAAEDEALLGELGDDDSVGDIHGDDDDELAAALHLAGDAMFSESGSPLEGVPVIGEAPELAGDDGLLVVAEPRLMCLPMGVWSSWSQSPMPLPRQSLRQRRRCPPRAQTLSCALALLPQLGWRVATFAITGRATSLPLAAFILDAF